MLVYAHDSREPSKQRIAQSLFAAVVLDGSLRISTQVLQEFFVTVTKHGIGMPTARAKKLVTALADERLEIVGPQHVSLAIDYSQAFRLGFWDGLILAAAKTAGSTTLFSEDFSHGQVHDGVRVLNPFRVTAA